MRTRERVLIGGIGGLAPVLMFLLTVDFDRIFSDATLPKTIGYLLRVVILFFVGGFVAYLHSDERNRLKLFEIGIAAPALIAGYISASQAVAPRHPGATENTFNFKLSVVPSVYAQANPGAGVVKKFTLPPQSSAEQFLEGLTGRSPKNVWFVIVGSHLQLEEAKKQANEINLKYPAFKATVYEPYGDNPFYAVVIGADLTQSDARALRDKAVQAGLPKDSYYKTFPGLPPFPQ